jgi:hypothetical protein
MHARRLYFGLLIATLIAPLTVSADGPSSSSISVVGARTLPSNSQLIAAELGWPGAYAALHMAAGSRLSLAFRGGLNYGSPFMSFAAGLGAQLETQARLHIYGHDNVDLALSLAAGGVVGEGALAGETGTYKDNLAFGAYVDPGLLASFAASRALTLTGGVFGSFAYVTVPDRNIEPSHLLGGVGVKLAVEALLSRDLIMFTQLTAGAGLRESGQFNNHTVLRLSLGAAYAM